MARTPTQKEIAAFIVAHGITDFVTGGRLSLLERNALWKVLKKLGPPAVSTTGRLAGQAAMTVPRLAGTAARGVRFVTMRHPYIAAAVVTYEVVKNREQIAQLAREGWQIVDETTRPALTEAATIAESAGAFDSMGVRAPSGLVDPIIEALGLPSMPKRKKSKYNRAVSAAMKAVKASTKGGKKGTIRNPKSVFKTVSKAVSKVNKGAKVATKGVTGIAARAARKILGKPKKKPKKGKGFTLKVKGRDY